MKFSLLILPLLVSCSLITINPDKSINILTKVKKYGKMCIEVTEPKKAVGVYCIEEIK